MFKAIYPSIFEGKRGICSRKCYYKPWNSNFSQHHNVWIIRELTCIQRGCYIDCGRNSKKKIVLTVEGFWTTNSYIILKCTLYVPISLKRGHIQNDIFTLQNYWFGTCALYPPFLRRCYRLRQIINGIKVLSYWKGDIERSQIFWSSSLVSLDNSKEIFINSNIIVFTPVILKLSVLVETCRKSATKYSTPNHPVDCQNWLWFHLDSRADRTHIEKNL